MTEEKKCAAPGEPSACPILCDGSPCIRAECFYWESYGFCGYSQRPGILRIKIEKEK